MAAGEMNESSGCEQRRTGSVCVGGWEEGSNTMGA
jgi:hypothetical protein